MATNPQHRLASVPEQNPDPVIEVDLNEVEMDQVVHLSDLKLPKGVQVAALLQRGGVLRVDVGAGAQFGVATGGLPDDARAWCN